EPLGRGLGGGPVLQPQPVPRTPGLPHPCAGDRGSGGGRLADMRDVGGDHVGEPAAAHAPATLSVTRPAGIPPAAAPGRASCAGNGTGPVKLESRTPRQVRLTHSHVPDDSPYNSS